MSNFTFISFTLIAKENKIVNINIKIACSNVGEFPTRYYTAIPIDIKNKIQIIMSLIFVLATFKERDY